MAGAWWVLSEARPGSWGVGAPVALAAAVLAGAIVPWPRHRLRALGLVRFVGFFARESLRGGADVARRALSPGRPLSPGLVELRTWLPAGAPRVLLADVVSLLPGTLTVDLDGDRVTVHGLDAGPALEAGFRALERRLADLFGLAAPRSPP
jgi:multicomponent Na+:H+ antiporter subunit E